MSFTFKNKLTIQTARSEAKTKPFSMNSPAANTSLLVQLTGSSLVDSSPNNFAFSNQTNIKFVTPTEPEWVGKTVLRVGNGGYSYATAPNSLSMSTFPGDFTLDTFLKITGGSWNESDNSGARIFGTEGSYRSGWFFQFDGAKSAVPSIIHYNSTAADISVSQTLTVGQLCHVAVARKNGVTKIFYNGNVVNSRTEMTGWSSSQILTLFSRGDNYRAGLQADIYMLRIVKGLALYDSAFTPSFVPVTLT